jgi:hypothetical protein
VAGAGESRRLHRGLPARSPPVPPPAPLRADEAGGRIEGAETLAVENRARRLARASARARTLFLVSTVSTSRHGESRSAPAATSRLCCSSSPAGVPGEVVNRPSRFGASAFARDALGRSPAFSRASSTSAETRSSTRSSQGGFHGSTEAAAVSPDSYPPYGGDSLPQTSRPLLVAPSPSSRGVGEATGSTTFRAIDERQLLNDH